MLPPRSMRAILPPLKAFIVILRTKDLCTPRPRCRPAHSRQMKVLNLEDAHCGETAGQSQQRSLPGRFCSARSFLYRSKAGLIISPNWEKESFGVNFPHD